ncbi:MAG: ABC transporter ATP-binding protein [Phycisphaerales bacterium]
MTEPEAVPLETDPPGDDPSSRPAIRLKDVRREYRAKHERVTALDGVSFEAPLGSWIALLGPNGSGKSTLLRVLATLDKPDAGGAEVLGRSTTFEADAVRASLGVVFQKPGLDALLSVRENLRLQSALVGMSKSRFRDRLEKVASQLAITDILKRRVARLSGGQKRRADLARALLTEPIVLLLDEATAGLDVEARRSFMEALQRVRSERPITILMTTHMMDEADRAGHVIMMTSGRIAAQGAPDELRRSLSENAQMVRTDPAYADMLEVAGLQVSSIGRHAVGAGAADAITAATAALVRSDIAFEVGPATLEDVYIARTGRSLAGTEALA